MIDTIIKMIISFCFATIIFNCLGIIALCFKVMWIEKVRKEEKDNDC